MRRLAVLCLLVASPFVAATAQQAGVADSSPFRPLPLPTPNQYRGGDGRPGPAYWQQRVDYTIAATLDPDRNLLTGRETIRYTNNAPVSLPYLWMFLEQNICGPESVTNQLHQPPLVFQGSVFDFSCPGFTGGLTLRTLRSGGRDLAHSISGTTMRVDLPEPLAPGATIELQVEWQFPVPPYGAGRMGHDGLLYEIAQWYPRMAVYDDVHGWNHEPYIGAGEFYLEYGAFDVSITLPASFVVAATGTLQNPGDVLTATQRQRLERARHSDSAVAIITASEAGNAGTRPATSGTLTWRFTADSVRDFAFAAAPNFRWDAVNWDGILIQTLYRSSASRWPEAIRMARAGIRHFSEQWFRYPYPHATTVEGPIEGMEYPMLTFVPNGSSREDMHWTLLHEFGHEWFPMIVGSNERLYPWMDEGFNTFIDIYGVEDYFRGTAYGDTVHLTPLHLYPAHAVPGQEQPLINRPVESRDLFWTAYRKPALMLHLLRHEVLGPEVFDRAFRDYTRTWAFKHPAPADFFRLMRDASGVDLDWYWREWVYTTARLDQAIDSVSQEGDSVHVHLSNRGAMVMPAELRLRYANGKEDTVRLPVEMWNLGDRFTYSARVPARVASVVLDPREVLPDVDRGNNVWGSE